MTQSENGRTYKADDKVMPGRFVKVSAAGQVNHAENGNNPVLGVTKRNTRRYDDTAHADADEQATVIETGDATAEVQVASAVSVGQMLIPTTSGKALPFVESNLSGVLSGEVAHLIGPALGAAAADGFVSVRMTQVTRQRAS